ncbi:MAG: MFS transporter [Candidatus Omnitrophica bacterium]|nr:MFS transporter [Candidatus Omnitrophota bacterium]
MAVLGVSSISPCLPKIAGEFEITAKDASLVIAVFTLPGVLFMPFLGFLADRWGRKKVVIPSLLLFALAGTACAFIRDFNGLLQIRFIQGIGAAPLGMVNLTLIGDLYTGKSRIRVMGLNAAILSLGTALYPLLGGMIAVDGWRHAFLLSLLAVPAALFALFYLKSTGSQSPRKFDLYFWNLLKSLRNVKRIGLFFSINMVFILIYGLCLTVFPFYMRDVFRASPAMIGLCLTILSLGTVVSAWWLSRLAAVFSEKRLIYLSFVCYLAVCILFPFMPSLWMVIGLTVVMGFANGLSVPTIQGLLTESSPAEHRGAIMSFNGMFLRLGQTLGPFLMGLVYTSGGMTAAFLIGCLVCLFTIFVIRYTVKG